MTFRMSELSRFQSPYDILGYMLRLISALWHRELNAHLREIDLTEMQFVILMGLGWWQDERPAGVSQKELADSCSCSSALTSQVIKGLVRKKFVSVIQDKEDGRAHLVRLTKAGEKKVKLALKVTEQIDTSFWDDHPDDAQKLAMLLRSLIKHKLGNETEHLLAMPGLDLPASKKSTKYARGTRQMTAQARERKHA